MKEPIIFKIYTLAHIKKLQQKDHRAARQKVLDIITHNISTLQRALDFCHRNAIRSFRISSDLIPHLTSMKTMNILNEQSLSEIKNSLSQISTHDIILSMHPGQHVNMGSPHTHVIKNSLRDLKEHFFVAEALGCREINIHVGGTYGDKERAKSRFIENMLTLIPQEKLGWMTIENDEFNYSVEDTVDIAEKLDIRPTYDIHHQRCYDLNIPDSRHEKEYLELCRPSWLRYNYQRVHISSPKYGYSDTIKSRPHHDYIRFKDFPLWLSEYQDIHLDIEAKAKELAIAVLSEKLQNPVLTPKSA